MAEFFEANAIQDSLQYNQIRSVAAALRRIANEEMTQAVNAAYAAHQFAKSANDSGEQVSSAQPLDLANAELLAVDTKLQGVLDSLNRSEASKRVREELQEILSTQRQLQEATTQLQLDILSEAPKTVVDANQLRISVEQQDLSRQLDALVQQASAMVDETEASADSLASVIQILNEKQTSAAMRLAAQRLATQQIVEAKQNQSQAIRDIEDALSISRDAANDSASRQADVLQSMGENLRALAERQRELAASIGRRDKSTRELLSAQQKLTSQLRQNREQSESQVQLDAFQNQLNELNSQQEAVEDAIRKESSSASAQANDVANALDALADDMFEQSQDVNDQNRRRQVQELVGRVESLVTQQAAHVANLEMADDSNSSNLLQLANEQDKIRNSAEQINKDVREVPAFGWTLQLASRDMLRSAAATRRRRLADARRTAARALDKLQMVLEALGSEQENRPSAQTNNADEQQSREGQMLPSVASIRLLRALQQSINEETQALNSRESQGENVTSFLSDLALEQQELGKQLEFILQAMKGNAR